MECFNIDSAWASVMTLRAVRAAGARSDSVGLGIFGPRDERCEHYYPNAGAEGMTPSGPSVSLHALTVTLTKNLFLV